MKLAEDVLALHDGIREVLILEERAGQFVVTEEAARDDTSLLADRMNEASRNAPLAPTIILGAASQFGGEPGALRIVGMLYRKGGIMFSHLDENRVLAISTSPESFSDVVEVVNKSLPRLREEFESRGKAGAVRSAAVAEDIARFFLEGKVRGPAKVSIDDVSYRGINHRWEVHGSYRSSRSILSKRFQVEVDAENGSVMRFSSSTSVSTLVYVELASLVAAVSLLGWWLYVTFWR